MPHTESNPFVRADRLYAAYLAIERAQDALIVYGYWEDKPVITACVLYRGPR